MNIVSVVLLILNLVNKMTQEFLKNKLQILPAQPGCYLMKNKHGKIIYIGKAKVLKNRVAQYFMKVHDYKTQKMVSQIVDFEYIVTKTEKEALLLEITLIKEHHPRYNIMFMDDKTYPYLKLTDEDYPRLTLARDLKKDRKATYFGPYPNAYLARRTLELLNTWFPLRKCRILPKKKCLYYDMKQCLGPCINKIDSEVYKEMRKEVIKVLNGDIKEIVQREKELMELAASELNYEKAATHLNTIKAFEQIADRQSIIFDSNENMDIFNYYEEKGYLSIQILHIRNGGLIERKSHVSPLYEEALEALESYIGQFYNYNHLPKQILTPKIDISLFEEAIKKRLFIPQRGRKHDLILMARENAKQKLEDEFHLANTTQHDKEAVLLELNKLFKREINRIDLFDNSHISGTNNVAGMVVYINGQPAKSEYRKYKLNEINSDVDSMKEVIYRRYLRALKEKSELPDLIIVDGGLPQIKAAKQVLDLLKIDTLLVGLAKNQKHQTALLLDYLGQEIIIDKSSKLFFFLAQMQEEVHRYAIAYHRQLRSKKQTQSLLLDIPGIGNQREKQLLKAFGSLKNIKEASQAELETVIPKNIAKNIINYFNQK